MFARCVTLSASSTNGFTMPITRTKKVSTVSPIVASTDFTVDVPVGPHQLELLKLNQGGTFTKAHVTNLDLELNGKAIQSFKNATQMELINAYYGRQVVANEIAFPFLRPEFRKYADARAFNLGLANVATCQLRGTIGAATSPTLTARADITQVPGANSQELIAGNQLGMFTKIKRFTHSPGASGLYEIDNIPKEAFIMAVHMVSANDNINSVEVKAGDVVVWDTMTTAHMEEHVERYGRVKQASCYHVDWMLHNELGSQLAVQGLSDLRFGLDMSADDTVDVYVEYLSTFAGI